MPASPHTGTFPKTASGVPAFPRALFQVASLSSSHQGREQPQVLVTGEWCGAGARLPAWVFSGWMVTKKSSNSRTVWLRISLKSSKGLVNQTWHLGKPWNPWAGEAALPDRTASPAGSPQEERPLGCCPSTASAWLPAPGAPCRLAPHGACTGANISFPGLSDGETSRE